jgi:hypothetical protein
MDEVPADRKAKAVHYDRNDEERHPQIEVSIQEIGASRRHWDFPDS